MQTACSSGYNTMLPTNESSSGFSSSVSMEHKAPQLQVVTSGMAGMQMNGNVSLINSMPCTPHRFGSASPLKRHNMSVDSPRAQLEQKQRRRFLEQKQMFGSSDMDAGPSTVQQQMPQYSNQRVNLWMQENHGGFQLPLNVKPFTYVPSAVSGMSGVSALSGMSNMTRFTKLSVDTRCSLQTNYDEVYGSYVYPQYPSPMISSENMDPQLVGPSLMDLLQIVMANNQVPEYRMRALKDLYDRIKSGYDAFEMNGDMRLRIAWVVTYLSANLEPYVIRSQILYVMERCLGILHELIAGVPQLDYQLIYQIQARKMGPSLIEFIGACFNMQLKNFAEAIVVLSSLLEFNPKSRYFSKLAAKTIHISTLMQLSDKSTKKSKLLNCMRFMLHESTVREQFIKQCNGIWWIMQQLNTDAAEKNLLVAMSIINLLSKNQSAVINQIKDLHGIQLIAGFLTHGSPALLYEVGKFLQNMGELIKEIDISDPLLIEEAVAKSLQMFGASDFTLVGYLSGFLCNFTTKEIPCQLVNKHNGVEWIVRLLNLLWYHELPRKTNRDDLNDCIDNLFFILCNLLSPNYDKNQSWSSTHQLSNTPNIMLFLLDVLQGNNIDKYVHRVVLLINRLLSNSGHLIHNLHTVFGANNMNYIPATINIYHRCIEQLDSEQLVPGNLSSDQTHRFTILNRTLALLCLLCHNPVLKAGLVANVKTKQCYSPLELLLYHCAKWSNESITIKTLELIDLLIFDILNSDGKDIAKSWSEFDILLEKSDLRQRFMHSQEVEHKLYKLSTKISEITDTVCENQNFNYNMKY